MPRQETHIGRGHWIIAPSNTWNRASCRHQHSEWEEVLTSSALWDHLRQEKAVWHHTVRGEHYRTSSELQGARQELFISRQNTTAPVSRWKIGQLLWWQIARTLWACHLVYSKGMHSIFICCTRYVCMRQMLTRYSWPPIPTLTIFSFFHVSPIFFLHVLFDHMQFSIDFNNVY